MHWSRCKHDVTRRRDCAVLLDWCSCYQDQTPSCETNFHCGAAFGSRNPGLQTRGVPLNGSFSRLEHSSVLQHEVFCCCVSMKVEVCLLKECAPNHTFILSNIGGLDT